MIRTRAALGQRTLFGSAVAEQPPLDQEFPGVPALQPASAKPVPATQMTKLSNGLRVASEETYGTMSFFALIVDAGSRYETDANNGVSHLLQHMAFKSTESRSSLRLQRDIEDLGANVIASANREFITYQVEVMRQNLEPAMEILADTILRPKLAAWDLETQHKTIGWELEDYESNQGEGSGVVLRELMHAAAYTDSSPLGRPLLMPKRNLGKIGAAEVGSFTSSLYTAPRMVLAGAGVEHGEFASLAETYFGGIPAEGAAAAPEVGASPYVGGEMRVRADAEFTSVALAFNGGSWHSDSLIPTCVLSKLLGGGASFSAGGPGKGMYSRLYLNVLNRAPWVESAYAGVEMYNDEGLLCLQGSSRPGEVGDLLNVLGSELCKVADGDITDEELSRAKNMLRSDVMMNLEHRSVIVEDTARQILCYGERETPGATCDKIAAVTKADIAAAAKAALGSAPTVTAYGDVSAMPSYESFAAQFASYKK